MPKDGGTTCICDDTIRLSECGGKWCMDCSFCHLNRSEVGVSWFCIYHLRGVAAMETCRRWEAHND